MRSNIYIISHRKIENMVKLSCIEECCQFETQDLTFDQAERILQMHLDRKHSNANPVCMTSTPVTSPSRQSKSHDFEVGVMLFVVPFVVNIILI